MPLLRGLLDRAVLIVGVFAGGMVPSYLAQYRQRVGGALGQALKDLAPFQEIANRFHDGSLSKLVQHHLASTDPTFRAEGVAIQAIVDSVAALRHAVNALDANAFQQLRYLITQGDPALLDATWAAFRPAFALSADSLVMALAFGLSVWLAFIALWWLLATLWARRALPPRRTRSRR
jgi:Protein of unknown function (DUF2937)